jgi:AraC-like DNA-binding protein
MGKGLGAYGQMLQRARTLHQYLLEGIAAYDRLITGQRVWLTEHGEELRFHVANANPPGIATYQAEVEALVVTIMKCREAAGPGWSPREVHLGYRTAEPLPDVEPLDGSRIRRGTGETYFTLPRTLLARRFPSSACSTNQMSVPASHAAPSLPTDLHGLVRLQVANLLPHRAHQIGTIAETLSMSERTLQRLMAEQNLSYSQVLAEVRLHQAVDWLENTEKPVGEIAFDLGYTDASNFTRAFRLKLGRSPQAFRDDRKPVAP